MEQQLLLVHEAAEAAGVSEDTVRRWEKKGLVRAIRNEFNHRLFDINSIRLLGSKLHGDQGGEPYRILKAKQTGFRCIDLFAGAGGTALGLENAGLKHSLLVEYDQNACQTLRSNRPAWKVIEDDIAKVDFRAFKDKIDVVEGGFPCQSFSYAGKKLGFSDTRGTLFYEFARCIKEVRPKVAIGENVRGLIRHDEGKTLETMLSALHELGYRVTWRLMRAQYLDVPQKRERVVIMAVRKDLQTPIFFPEERNYTIPIREALKACPVSEGQKYPKRKEEILAMVPPGGYWRDLPLKVQKEFMGRSYYQGGGKTGMARRLSWDEPSLTLTCSPAQKQTERCHPEEDRPLTVREYARIQTFPDDWTFVGSTAARYKQIGNAVPVNLGFHVGKCAIAMLAGKKGKQMIEA
ncbi:DNA (cytosine-5-)-methyltransferase [Candidatus Uhrbacteria bacterium]|nr:DNA (cytosine-5-)-methyltransferase [Candidatus Uhrbacteria bacterium]